jgi:hypothetical protein
MYRDGNWILDGNSMLEKAAGVCLLATALILSSCALGTSPNADPGVKPDSVSSTNKEILKSLG